FPSTLTVVNPASSPLGLATAAITLYAKQPSGIGLNPLFDSSVNYSGQAALVIGGTNWISQPSNYCDMVKFGPIITYVSGQHSEYLRSLDATECIDRKQVSISELPEAVKKLTAMPMVAVVYDMVSSDGSQ
ncbi:hypothetical protein K435DRAFT_668353, partial [Dendrothele bispora CBS 962.96]